MKPSPKPIPHLAEIEREVVAEAREWGRRRLEQRLQEVAEEHGGIFPPQAAKKARDHAAQRTRRGKNRP